MRIVDGRREERKVGIREEETGENKKGWKWKKEKKEQQEREGHQSFLIQRQATSSDDIDALYSQSVAIFWFSNLLESARGRGVPL